MGVIAYRRHIVAASAIFGLLATWVAMAELLQGLQDPGVYPKPWAITYVVHSGYMLVLPVWAALRHVRMREGRQLPVSFSNLLLGASLFQALGAVVACTWYLSLQQTTVGVNNAVYQSSSAFVFLFSLALLGEGASYRKFAACGLSLSGIAVVTWGAPPQSETSKNTPTGLAWVVLSSLLYSLYEVLYARLTTAPSERKPACACRARTIRGTAEVDALLPSDDVEVQYVRGGYAESENGAKAPSAQTNDPEDNAYEVEAGDGKNRTEDTSREGSVPAVDRAEMAALVLGFMGLFTLTTLWPGFFIAQAIGLETPQWPDQHSTRLLALNAGLDSIYNACLLLGISILSPLAMSLASVLVVPASLCADWAVHGTVPGPAQIGGSAMLALGFVLMQTGPSSTH